VSGGVLETFKRDDIVEAARDPLDPEEIAVYNPNLHTVAASSLLDWRAKAWLHIKSGDLES
jgi:hypothetical protein